MGRKFFMCVILAGIAMTGWASSARAGFELEYSVNGGTYTVVTGSGSGTLLSPYAAIASVGGLTISATGGGTTTMPFSSIDLSMGGVEAANTTISILVSMTGTETSPPPVVVMSAMGAGLLTGNQGQTPGAAITMADYLAQSNAFFDIANPVVGPQNIAASSTFDSTVTAAVTAPFSWTLSMTLNNSANAYSTNNMSLTNDATMVPTPAPGGLVLVIAAAPVLLGGTWWRRRKAQLAS